MVSPRCLLTDCQKKLQLCIHGLCPAHTNLTSGPILFLRYGGSALVLSLHGTCRLINRALPAVFQAFTFRYNIWRMVFFTPTQKAMVLEDALRTGYGVTTTRSRLVLRSGYDMPETYVENVSMENVMLLLVVFLNQCWFCCNRWMACPWRSSGWPPTSRNSGL